MTKVGIGARALRLIAAGGVAAAVMLPGVAHADTTSCSYASTNCGSSQGTQSSGSSSGNSTSSDGSSLPFTGGDVVGLALIGAGAVVGGTVLVRSGRRRTVDADA
jgi:hypothetical protein